MVFKLGLRRIVAESLHDLHLAFEHCLDLIAILLDLGIAPPLV